jgi:hypothetical protein
MVSFKYTKLDGLSSASLGDELLDVGHREPNRLWTNLFPSNFLPMAIQPVFALVETLRISELHANPIGDLLQAAAAGLRSTRTITVDLEA